MEIAKEKWFEVKFNTRENELHIKKPNLVNKMKVKYVKSKIKNSFRKHKFITTIGITFLIFSSINAIMIYNFFKVLQNI